MCVCMDVAYGGIWVYVWCCVACMGVWVCVYVHVRCMGVCVVYLWWGACVHTCHLPSSAYTADRGRGSVILSGFYIL